MAISASKSKTIYSSASSTYGYTLYVKFTETATSIANNTSSISISGYMKGNNIGWSSNYNSYLRLYWHDNNTNKDKLIATSSGFKSLAMNTKKNISGTTTVTHKSDGSLSGYAKLTYTAGSNSGGYAPASNNVSTNSKALTKIARASSISSVSGTYLGSAVTVAISRKSSNFTHKVEYSFAGSGYITASSSATTSATFTPSLSLASNIPNSTSGTLTVRVTTYNGSTKVGSSVTSTKTLSLPASVVPTISSVSASRINNSVPSSWGVYVKGVSGVTLAFGSVSGAYGSTIRSYSISGTGVSSSSTSTSYNPIGSSGTLTYTFKVTDSRGRTATKTISISVVDYSVPSISVTASRCDSSGTVTGNGTYLRVTANYSISSVSGKNSVSSRSVRCNNVSNTTFTSGTAFTLAANCAIGSSYALTASVTDALGKSASVTYDIPTASRIMNVKANKKGIAFGKFAENDNEVDIDWDLRVRGYLRDALRSAETGTSWIYGRDIAALKNENNPRDSWLALTSSKTQNGSFETGTIFDSYYIAYTKDTDYEAGTNNYVPFKFSNDGKFTCESMITSDWFRSLGGTGWYNETYGGGIYMKDSTYVRVYNSKGFVVDGVSHLQNGINTIGTHRFNGQWLGFYNTIGDAQNNTRRKGWMGFNESSNFNIYNDAGGGIVLHTSSDNVDLQGKRIKMTSLAGGGALVLGDLSGYNGYFSPLSGQTKMCLGTTSYYWYRLYSSLSVSVVSDIRKKTNIKEYDERFENMYMDLKPITYELKDDLGQSHCGLIAQWTKEAMDKYDICENEFGAYIHDKDTDSYSICYEELVSLNMHMIQKIIKRVDTQEDEIAKLKNEIAILQLKLNA